MERPKLDKVVTCGESLGYAMTITTEEEAKSYFDDLVKYHLEFGKPDVKTEEQAVELVRQNLGYYAGYYSPEIGKRVLELFGAAHPIFGKTATA